MAHIGQSFSIDCLTIANLLPRVPCQNDFRTYPTRSITKVNSIDILMVVQFHNIKLVVLGLTAVLRLRYSSLADLWIFER